MLVPPGFPAHIPCHPAPSSPQPLVAPADEVSMRAAQADGGEGGGAAHGAPPTVGGGKRRGKKGGAAAAAAADDSAQRAALQTQNGEGDTLSQSSSILQVGGWGGCGEAGVGPVQGGGAAWSCCCASLPAPPRLHTLLCSLCPKRAPPQPPPPSVAPSRSGQLGSCASAGHRHHPLPAWFRPQPAWFCGRRAGAGHARAAAGGGTHGNSDPVRTLPAEGLGGVHRATATCAAVL